MSWLTESWNGTPEVDSRLRAVGRESPAVKRGMVGMETSEGDG